VSPVFLLRVETAMRHQLDGLRSMRCDGFVCSELAAVATALQVVLDKGLARGPVFCEWGSGLGAVCAVASQMSFEVYGIEIQPDLVDAARCLLTDLGLDAELAHGSFLMPGDEALVLGCDNTRMEVSRDVYRDLGVSAAAVDIVFAYPWPGEEAMHDQVFSRHATAGALLLTFHENSRVLVQRHMGPDCELMPVEWVG
jgi:hypothetical protein